MSAFHIQKTPIDVEVWTTDGDEPGTVNVAPFAKSHSGVETVLDLMNGPEAFLPIICGRRVDLFAKSCIQALWYQEAFEPPPGIVFVEHRVLVQLRGRAPFEVLLRDERPPGKERVSDFLNDESPYIVTFREGRNVLIAKQHLIRVVPAFDGVLPELGDGKTAASAPSPAAAAAAKKKKPAKNGKRKSR